MEVEQDMERTWEICGMLDEELRKRQHELDERKCLISLKETELQTFWNTKKN